MIELEKTGQVAHVRLNRPDKLNAMNWDFWTGMPRIMEEINSDMSIRVAVISGAGKAFSVGLDVMDVMARLMFDEGELNGESKRKLHQTIRDMQWTVTSVERCRVPVIAAIHGYCLGGAIDLISACDIRLASTDAVFSVRETKMALVADIGTLQRLPRIVPPGIARELVYTGRDFDSEYAEEIGLVNRRFESKDATLTGANELALEIATNAPLAVQGSKQTLNYSITPDIDRELEYVATFNAAHLFSQDLQEAIRAFATKTKPEFRGR